MIRNAWHCYYALNLVIKVVTATSVLCCSPLSMALCIKANLHILRTDVPRGLFKCTVWLHIQYCFCTFE
ncbi:hypothetical protein B7489_08605 [Vibrio alginolyticus]|nr:hypothetical protein B7489_08605 [Vibrio alginolyticus]